LYSLSFGRWTRPCQARIGSACSISLVLITFDVHWRSLMFIDVHWRSLTFIDVHWRSFDVHWRSLTFIDVHWCSLTFIDVHLTFIVCVSYRLAENFLGTLQVFRTFRFGTLFVCLSAMPELSVGRVDLLFLSWKRPDRQFNLQRPL
jgi:hypothetical protein